jgi:hypothetical protein
MPVCHQQTNLRNGYVLRNGIHHIVMPSILETPPDRDAYATLDVTPSALILRGHDTCMSLILRVAGPTGAPLAQPLPLRTLAPWAEAAVKQRRSGGDCTSKAVEAAAASNAEGAVMALTPMVQA